MPSRGHAVIAVEWNPQTIPSDLSELQKPGLAILSPPPVELAAITGREKHCRHSLLPELLQRRGNLGRGEGEPLPLLNRGCMVAYTNDMEGWDRRHAQG
jgi:hypothetical protein